METNALIYALLAFIVIREVIFQVSLQRLVNKLMSRSFYEYQTAKSVGKLEESKSAPTDSEDYGERAREVSAMVGL